MKNIVINVCIVVGSLIGIGAGYSIIVYAAWPHLQDGTYPAVVVMTLIIGVLLIGVSFYFLVGISRPMLMKRMTDARRYDKYHLSIPQPDRSFMIEEEKDHSPALPTSVKKSLPQ